MVWKCEMFVLPGVIGRDIGRPAAELEDGKYVGFGGVADHEERAGVDFFVREKGGVGLGRFVVDDEIIDVLMERGIFEFSLLLVEFAFCDDDDAVVFLKGVERLDGAVEHDGGDGEQEFADIDDFEDGVRGEGGDALCGAFEHRHGHGFCAVSEAVHVLRLDGEEARCEIGMPEVSHDVVEAAFGFRVEALVFPEGVVCVKCDASEWNVFSHNALKNDKVCGAAICRKDIKPSREFLRKSDVEEG